MRRDHGSAAARISWTICGQAMSLRAPDGSFSPQSNLLSGAFVWVGAIALALTAIGVKVPIERLVFGSRWNAPLRSPAHRVRIASPSAADERWAVGHWCCVLTE